MTQLVGRILRQPDAMKTRVEALDECHIITHHAGTGAVVEAIKAGLEQDGLGDLVLQVSQEDAGGVGHGIRKIDRCPAFSSTEIYLPKVMVLDGSQMRELDYETDVLSHIEWQGFDPEKLPARIPERTRRPSMRSCGASG